MKTYRNHTLKDYCQVLSQKTPVPGGGSVAALTGALGVSLLSMTACYAQPRVSAKKDQVKIRKIIASCRKLQAQLLECVDEDARAYLQVVKTKRQRQSQYQSAVKKARQVPLKICRLCYEAINYAPYIIEHGSRYLMSDVKIAVEMLNTAFRSAMITAKVNPSTSPSIKKKRAGLAQGRL